MHTPFFLNRPPDFFFIKYVSSSHATIRTRSTKLHLPCVCNNIMTRYHTAIWEEAASPKPHSSYTLVTLHCASPYHQKLPFTVGRIWTPSNAWFIGTARLNIPDGMWIESAVFPEFTVVTNGQTDRPTERTGTRPVGYKLLR